MEINKIYGETGAVYEVFARVYTRFWGNPGYLRYILTDCVEPECWWYAKMSWSNGMRHFGSPQELVPRRRIGQILAHLKSPAKGMSGLYRRIEPKEAVRCIAMCIVVMYRCFRELLKKAASPSGAVRVKGGYPTGLLLPCASVWGGEPRPNIGVSMSRCILASSLRSFACHVSQDRPHTCLREFMHEFIHSFLCGRSRIEFR